MSKERNMERSDVVEKGRETFWCRKQTGTKTEKYQAFDDEVASLKEFQVLDVGSKKL